MIIKLLISFIGVFGGVVKGWSAPHCNLQIMEPYWEAASQRIQQAANEFGVEFQTLSWETSCGAPLFFHEGLSASQAGTFLSPCSLGFRFSTPSQREEFLEIMRHSSLSLNFVLVQVENLKMSIPLCQPAPEAEL